MKKHPDYFLLILILFLSGFGLLFFACVSSSASLQKFGPENSNYFLIRQILFGFLPAIILGLVAYKISLSFLKKIIPWLLFFNIIALFLVFIPGIGVNAGGATRWINIFGFNFQPSEFFKITSILYLSAWISSKLSEKSASDWKSLTKRGYHNIIYIFLPFIVFLGIIAIALYLQRDASTLGVISLTLLALYFSSRTPLWHTILIIFAGVSYLLFMVRFEQYRLDRWLIFLNPDADPLGKGFQVKQSLISLGSGGVFGQGLGMSTQKFGFLPSAMTDSIFAIIGEELGIIGCIAIIVAFVLLFWMGVKISKKSNDKFAKMVSMGIVTWITLQAFINIASTTGIFPLTGIPLPFFSSGGSHLIVEFIAMGLLLNISKNTT